MTDDRFDDEPIDPPRAVAETAAAQLMDDAVPADNYTRLTPAERMRVADLQWLHSLLQQTLHRDAVARDRRITRACLAIRGDAARQVQPAAQRATRRPRWLVPSLVAAALIAVAVLMRGTGQDPSRMAVAAVESTLQQAKSSEDRLYRVETQWQPPGELPVVTLTGDLWVRGNTQYLLRQQSPVGDLYLGSNGTEHWFAAPVGPVVVGNQPRRFEQMALGKPVATPYLQITSVLEQLSDRYELTLADEEELPAAEDKGTVRCTHVIGRKRDPEDRLAPDVIELWTARQSGIAYRIRVRWTGESRGPKELQVQLMPLTAPLPSDWYDHGPHHAAERRVVRRPGAALIGTEQ